MKSFQESPPLYKALGAIGLLALVGFTVAFMNIPWDWSMFMDDTAYNSWMPNVTNMPRAIHDEIFHYLAMGRFYPVKYIANLLKWRYLPNDPYIFRYFNYGVFLLATSIGSLTALQVNRKRLAVSGAFAAGGLFFFLLGSSLLHKPILEIISLNPLGETWVCLFLAMGAFCLVREQWSVKFVLARFFFLVVALSKEPAALVFFASSLHYAYRAWLEPHSRKKWALHAAFDFLLFGLFLAMSLNLLAHSSWEKAAYFGSTPWLTYAHDFFYKLARYALWTSPFVAGFIYCRREIVSFFRDPALGGAIIFFATFAMSYEVFMSSQGIVAYQEVPAAMGFFCLFALLTAALAASGALERAVYRSGLVLLLLFCLSYYVSLSRWQRFVRGIVEPRRAVTNLIQTGYTFTIFVPFGEIYGHLELLLKQYNPSSQVFEIDKNVASLEPRLRGKIFVFEFPTYMGDLPKERLSELERMAGGWESVTDAHTYRIYVGKKTFGERPL